ncbi:MAG: proline--tRNA ligase [Deltaproteobacteria bacterium]|nr:proline--tRNA ligase [Deltaproteobacteria bacterium]MBM4294709.1 proline--tRNA ligase [Deltaproteobacteria bacterium]
MLFSRMLIPTLKEDPSEAEADSHKLLLRAGMMRKLTAGIYNYLPVGLRALRKVENIVREEMNRAGAQEVLMPAVQPAELWQESGRWNVYGKELLRFKDRHGRDYCFGPTHEEVITDLVRREVQSYRQLPLNLYQIQVKFRDEIRPRFGLIRGREFIMKDAYSFHTDEAEAEAGYQAMYDAYNRIFTRCGLKFKTVEADTGPIGGSYSHEFMVLADTGEDLLASCTACDYAANLEKAEVILPANNPAVPAATGPEAVHTPNVRTVEEVAAFLKVTPQEIVKTLIYETDKGPVAVLIRGDHEVNEVKVRNLLGVTDLILAGPARVEELTGAEVGFAGAVGLNIPIYADQAAAALGSMVTGANRTGYHLVGVAPQRDFAMAQAADLRTVTQNDPCPRCGGALDILRGIEVGHVFKLGLKYSKALKAVYLDADGAEQFIFMGCYGIGVSRIVAAAIEQGHDKDGIIWPMALAPFQAAVIPISVNEAAVVDAALRVHEELEAQGVEVLLDDRDERPGVKFKDCDLLGIPLRVVVGPKTLAQAAAEVRHRRKKDTAIIPLDDLIPHLKERISRELHG